MPTVRHHRNESPLLRLTKPERDILLNAQGLCVAIRNATLGHSAELAAEASDAAERLDKLAAITELDLSKPW